MLYPLSTIFFATVRTISSLLLLGLGLSLSLPAIAQPYPKGKAKRAFSHSSEANRGKNNKARFRHEGNRPIIDLRPHKLESFKTAKSPKPYQYYNPR